MTLSDDQQATSDLPDLAAQLEAEAARLMTLSSDRRAALDQRLADLRERVDPLIADCQTRAAARLADLRERLKRREAERE